ncbi:hypothetical protein POPTR_001G198800v4 [Populus trichocarpa]|uniref:Uncharacterized protein n=1 Tax=Populus trichocarpa TaxID=3694 RepID=B9N1A6_POPTR|nr:hypothetical protein POPTR_001G198800v4 [Populus trichocarpa]
MTLLEGGASTTGGAAGLQQVTVEPVVADEECLPLLLRSCSRCWCREVRCCWWFFLLLRGCVDHELQRGDVAGAELETELRSRCYRGCGEVADADVARNLWLQ